MCGLATRSRCPKAASAATSGSSTVRSAASRASVSLSLPRTTSRTAPQLARQQTARAFIDCIASRAATST